MLKKQKLNQSGFGILEVVVTLFLVAVTFLLFQVTANSITLNKFSRYREIALRIADKQMQTLRTTPFAELPASGPFSDPLLSSLPSGQGTMTLEDSSDTMKDVTVTVTWVNPSGTGTQQMRLQTYIYQGGLGQ